ncbi:MAG: DNA mismatch repair protein MutT [Betaproteobacteria bacterium HGW-Betaproteobacteria-11]|nr:MAG: DNA mismatch repair protein MutT [Betaproteobacteria bacterium HGW-Betaproteobacteria-11]
MSERQPAAASPAPRKLTEVAAAVIERPDGRFLLGQRAADTFYPGYWEFPGGKIEPGETPLAALCRELNEELGITVLRADPWLRREHVYPHAHVRLYFYRVRAWRGEIRDHVHSALAWQEREAPTVVPMLPANAPVLAALALPEFYAITQAGEMGIAAQLAALETALAAGLRLVQVREPGLSAAARGEFAQAAVALCHRFGARVLINGDPALARQSGADGVHLPARLLATLTARPDFPLVAASCHTPRELECAARLGCDFVVYGPVRESTTHPGQAGLGWAAFAAQIGVPPAPTFALGSLCRDDLDAARAAGAHGVAAIRAAWQAV